jgi:hypothetical protein
MVYEHYHVTQLYKSKMRIEYVVLLYLIIISTFLFITNNSNGSYYYPSGSLDGEDLFYDQIKFYRFNGVYIVIWWIYSFKKEKKRKWDCYAS